MRCSKVWRRLTAHLHRKEQELLLQSMKIPNSYFCRCQCRGRDQYRPLMLDYVHHPSWILWPGLWSIFHGNFLPSWTWCDWPCGNVDCDLKAQIKYVAFFWNKEFTLYSLTLLDTAWLHVQFVQFDFVTCCFPRATTRRRVKQYLGCWKTTSRFMIYFSIVTGLRKNKSSHNWIDW